MSGPRIAHVALWVRDLERMRQFYVTHLGGQSGTHYQNLRTGFSSYFISLAGECRVELMHRADRLADPGSGARGYAHLALALGTQTAVDAAVRQLREAGVTVESEPRTTGDGYYEAVIVDPEGNRIELVA